MLCCRLGLVWREQLVIHGVYRSCRPLEELLNDVALFGEAILRAQARGRTAHVRDIRFEFAKPHPLHGLEERREGEKREAGVRRAFARFW